MRELRRNGTRHDGWYRPQLADWYARGRRSRSRRNQRFSPAERRQVGRLLERQWSPEQVAGYLRRHRRLRISHETIYRYIWADKQQGGTLYTHLRGARKQRRKRYGAYNSRGRLAGKPPDHGASHHGSRAHAGRPLGGGHDARDRPSRALRSDRR